MASKDLIDFNANKREVILNVGDTVNVPSTLCNNGKRTLCVVQGVYKHYVLVERKPGIKFCISNSDLGKLDIVMRAYKSKAMDNEEKNILDNV